MNRGSSDVSCVLIASPAASMRPRFMNRGSSVETPSSKLIANGFNEAPIHESGKYERQRKEDAELKSFNEAPIHESGKCCNSSSLRS